MAYLRSNLVVRPAYAGIGDSIVAELGGVWDDAKTFVQNTVNAFGEAKKAQGAAAAQTATVVAPPSSFPTGTVLAVGGIGLAALLILKRKKK